MKLLSFSSKGRMIIGNSNDDETNASKGCHVGRYMSI